MLNKMLKLIELGAGEFEHVDTLHLAILDDTRCLLKAWAASDVLQQAGLYHSVYVSIETLVEGNIQRVVEQREAVAHLLGSEVEQIIYYCHVCDYAKLLERHNIEEDLILYDQLLHENIKINEVLLKNVCELAIAIEVSKAFMQLNGRNANSLFLRQMLDKMHPYLSRGAKNKLSQFNALC
jgi:hypothetical protein